jgi:hypothetical protein
MPRALRNDPLEQCEREGGQREKQDLTAPAPTAPAAEYEARAHRPESEGEQEGRAGEPESPQGSSTRPTILATRGLARGEGTRVI